MTKTHTMRSRLISLVLVLVMVLGCLPLSALAVDTESEPLESTFNPATAGAIAFGDFHVKAVLTDGYKLQTVGSEDTHRTWELPCGFTIIIRTYQSIMEIFASSYMMRAVCSALLICRKLVIIVVPIDFMKITDQ